MAPTTAADVRRVWASAIAAQREAAQRSQAELAAAVGVDQKTISNIERGIGSLDTFVKVSTALGLDLLAVTS